MRTVKLDAVVRDCVAADVFDNVMQFERFPVLAPHVQSTTVTAGPPARTGRSSWELHFRSGLLRWTEDDVFDPDRLRTTFEQTTGDFDEFTGSWQLTQDGPDTRVEFRADFDFGIASLAGILDPIAERVITETVAWVLVGMFDRVDLDAEIDLKPAEQPSR
jgi:ribosome-associated toxin RatA of RatAB toxin-antitoxin module